MIKPFEFYIKSNLVKKTKGNISLARSLLQKAEVRLSRVSKNHFKDEESSIVFEDIYELIREATQSIMELNSYKPYSHEALVSFVKYKRIFNESESNIFDNYRILRNNSVYNAEKVSLEKCKESLEFAKNVLPKIKKNFEEIVSKLNK